MGSSISSHPLSILHRTDRWRGTSKLSKQDFGRHFLGSHRKICIQLSKTSSCTTGKRITPPQAPHLPVLCWEGT
ncbi:unnamed protein product [Nesidiocoris tenuis]|uniref:Uncharacterized protein n=1 Tax=Nesidiocoris tenuis TaxID=355587 RepID=A0A6H5HGG1_9HEMI|nr:unnamed protein product [Nesidiocoris tenuis]